MVAPCSAIFPPIWPTLGPGWASWANRCLAYVGPSSDLGHRPTLAPRSWTLPARTKRANIWPHFLRFFPMFSIFFDFPQHHHFPSRPPKATRQTPNLARRSAQCPQDRPARPSKHAQDRAKIGQHRQRWAMRTADYAPNLPKDLRKHFNTHIRLEIQFKCSMPMPITQKNHTTTSQSFS